MQYHAAEVMRVFIQPQEHTTQIKDKARIEQKQEDVISEIIKTAKFNFSSKCT